MSVWNRVRKPDRLGIPSVAGPNTSPAPMPTAGPLTSPAPMPTMQPAAPMPADGGDIRAKAQPDAMAPVPPPRLAPAPVPAQATQPAVQPQAIPPAPVAKPVPPAGPNTSPAPMPAVQPPPPPAMKPAAPGMTLTNTAPAQPPAPPAPAQIPSVGISGYGPGNDLRASQINPVASDRLTAAQGATGAAASRVQGFDPTGSTLQGAQQIGGLLKPRTVGVDGVDPTQSGRALAAAGRTDAAAANLAGVDRFGIAKQRLDQFNAEQAPVAEAERRNLLKNNAAMGRLGSGMLRTDFGSLSDKLDLNRRSMETQVLTDALEGTIGDQFDKTNALAGLEGQVYGQDAGLRGERRQERDTRLGVDERNVGREFDAARTAIDAGMGLSDRQGSAARSAYDVAGNYESGIAGQEASARGELRGERGFQNDMQKRAQDAAIEQWLMQQQAKNTEFGQGAHLAGLGFGGNPSGALADAASGKREQTQGAYDPIMQWLMQQQGKKPAGTP